MRILLVIVILVGVFVLLLRVVPPVWALPLYLFFAVMGMGYVWWERKRIEERRSELRRALRRERMEWEERLPWNNEEEE